MSQAVRLSKAFQALGASVAGIAGDREVSAAQCFEKICRDWKTVLSSDRDWPR